VTPMAEQQEVGLVGRSLGGLGELDRGDFLPVLAPTLWAISPSGRVWNQARPLSRYAEHRVQRPADLAQITTCTRWDTFSRWTKVVRFFDTPSGMAVTVGFATDKLSREIWRRSVRGRSRQGARPGRDPPPGLAELTGADTDPWPAAWAGAPGRVSHGASRKRTTRCRNIRRMTQSEGLSL
jgi:hypothetical protein